MSIYRAFEHSEEDKTLETCDFPLACWGIKSDGTSMLNVSGFEFLFLAVHRMTGSVDPRPPFRSLEARGQLKGARSPRVGGNTPQRSQVSGRTAMQGPIS